MASRLDNELGAWAKSLRPASFRGVPFFVASADGAHGRRTARHEYPLRDLAYVEDLGRRTREFTIEAFVLGATYMAARDKLVDAIEQPGPGALVHPYRGEIKVVATDFRVRETTAEGGMARFTITFVETGENVYPEAEPLTGQRVGTAADTAVKATEEDFAKVFSVDGKPEFVSDSAVGQIENAITRMRVLSGRIAAATSPITKFSAQLDRIKTEVRNLIRVPGNLAADITGAIGALGGVARTPGSSLDAYRKTADTATSSTTVPTTTASRRQESANQKAMNDLLARTATIEAARAATQITFESHEEAVAVRVDLADRLDTLMESCESDVVYQALEDLRVEVVRDVTTRGADLARTARYTPAATLPALALAYAVHGDAARADEIVARNNVRHPGFVPGGASLEVLTDA